MSSESTTLLEADGVERRLHPLSWLFTLIGQLKQFALPLIVLLVTGQRNDADLYGLIGVGVLALVSVARYFTYRYRIEADGVVIRSGLFQRSVRHIPFTRIQNVTLHQGVLHRLFGVAEVRLESAGAAKPEGQMRVLRLADAHALEQVIRGHGSALESAAGVAQGMPVAPPVEQVLLELPTSEVLRLGLVDNRGMLVVGGAFAILGQNSGKLIGRMFENVGDWLSGQAQSLHLGLVAMVLAGIFLLLLALVVLRIFSMLIALLQFHGFKLTRIGGRLRIERGLLTKLRGSVPRHRIQAYTMREGVLHRWLGRRKLRVDTAVSEGEDKQGSLRDLAPIATPATIDMIVGGLLPQGAWPISEWHALHPRAWRRHFIVPAVLLLVAIAISTVVNGTWSLAALPLLLWPYLSARTWARYSAYAVSERLVAFRSGWLGRRWRFAERDKLQAIELLQSPFDRRNGMASLRFDTAGASSGSEFRIPYLPAAEARRLYLLLAAHLS